MKKLLILTIIAILASCGGEEKKKTTAPTTTEVKAKFAGIKNNDQFILGNDLNVKIQLKDLDKLKNLEVFLGDKLVYAGQPKEDFHVISIKTDSLNVGFTSLKLTASFEGEEKPVGDNRNIVFFSNLVPQLKVAQIVRKFPHNPKSYTQGLEFDGDQLWEGTGQRGQSLVAKVNLADGSHKEIIEIEKTLFGEGITIMGDKVYQLTWEAGRCLVYDKNILQKVNEFSYSGEGWGLANNGESLLMTDGSSKIVFRNPETFEITKTIYIFDHSKEWNLLNELEWIDGKIYANVYQKTDILVIDPETGKVEQVIDAYDAARELKMGNPKSDVLNGLAYKASTKELYITGKNFPSLASVKVVDDLP